MPSVETADPDHRTSALWRPLRALAAACILVAAANLLRLAFALAMGLVTGETTTTPYVVLRDLALLSAIPRLVAWVIVRLARARVRAESDTLVVERRGERVDVPRASIAAVRPLRLPLPAPGLALRLASGRLFNLLLALPDPTPLASALDAAAAHPMLRFAAARARYHRSGPGRLALKFLVFPLLPALVLFRLYQLLTFGGLTGQWQMFGLAPYLRTASGYYLGTVAHLVVWAGVWRILGECLAYAAAWALPSRTRGPRAAVEWTCRIVYWVGVPALLGARFLV